MTAMAYARLGFSYCRRATLKQNEMISGVFLTNRDALHQLYVLENNTWNTYIPKLYYLIIYPCPNPNWTMTVDGGPLRQRECD